MAKKFRDFKSAREFVRKTGVKSAKEWRTYCKSGNKPEDIPSAPNQIYKNKGWIGWGDFFRTGKVANYNKKFRDFESAREFVRSLGFERQSDWFEFCRLGKKPKDIPYSPNEVYKDKGWKGYGDWIGTGKLSSKEISENFLSFKEARDEVRKLAKQYNIKNWKDWQNAVKKGLIPKNIPAVPNQTYKNKGWINWGDFLGTGNVATKDMVFRDFKSAREFARSLGLRNTTEWREYCKSNNKPEDIPYLPYKTYKENGWIGYGDWLGTGNVREKEFRDFKSTREFARGLEISSAKEWFEFCKSGNKPEDIPAVPNQTYKNKGWINWGDFLGTGRIADQIKSKQYLPFKEAREEARKLAKQYNIKNWIDWRNTVKKGLIPKNIPANPNQTYSKSRKKKRE